MLRCLSVLSLLISVSIGVYGENEENLWKWDAEKDSVSVLQEVSVLAVKQEEKLRGEALSSTTLGSFELEQAGAVSVKGISDMVPNFYMPDYGSRTTSTIYVRGIGARMDQPAVGLNVDNVPYLNKNAYDFDLADISSVEMLRGPQSLLFGRNTMGGLINVTTLSPLQWQGWKISLQGGMGNDWRTSVGWYHKFNEKTAFAAIANFSYLGGFFRNQYDGTLLDNEKSGSVRLKFDRRISQDLYLQNVLSTSVLRQGGYPYESVERGEISYNDPCYYHRFTLNDGLTLKWRTEKFNLTSVSAVQWLDDNLTLDQDFLPESYFVLTQKQKELGVTEDIIIKGSELEGNYQWLAGVFGFYKHLDMVAPVTFKDVGISKLIEGHRNEHNPEYPILWDSREFVLNSDFNLPTGGVAVYHQSKYDLDRWHFTLGLRLDWEQTKLKYKSYCKTGYEVLHYISPETYEPYSHKNIDIHEIGNLKRNYFNWMPKLTVLWDAGSDRRSNLYLNVSKGWKSGGFNTQMFSDVLQQRLMGQMGLGSTYDVNSVVGYRPEYSWNYELGAHLDFLESRLGIDISTFYIDCRDQQLTMFPDGTTTGRIMTNAGKTRSVGGELSVNWHATDKIDVNASYGFTDARFVKFNDGIADYAGKFLPYVPNNTFYLQGIGTWPVHSKFLKGVVTELSLRGTGKIYWNEANTINQPFYLLPGASVTLQGRVWSLQIWGKNLSNTRYHTFYFLSMGNEFLQQGRPIQIGATLRFDI